METNGADERREARVVVGVETSLAGLAAVRYAVAEARRRGTPLQAVRAWQFNVPWRGYDVDQARAEAAARAAGDVIDAFNLALGGVPAGLVVELLTHEGPVAGVLLAHATRADDVLVIGSASRRIAGRSLVDAQCQRDAPCPVVIVPPPALARQASVNGLVRDVIREAERVAQAAGGGPAPWSTAS